MVCVLCIYKLTFVSCIVSTIGIEPMRRTIVDYHYLLQLASGIRRTDRYLRVKILSTLALGCVGDVSSDVQLATLTFEPRSYLHAPIILSM
jgi:hypothetical protein